MIGQKAQGGKSDERRKAEGGPTLEMGWTPSRSKRRGALRSCAGTGDWAGGGYEPALPTSG
jgi:hypothetical protein